MSDPLTPPSHAAAPAALPAPPLPRPDDRWALFLDVDGCLLDFGDDPEALVVPPTLHDLLSDLHARLEGALALVSGRHLDSLGRLFAMPGWTMAGLHGLELRRDDGRQRRIEPDPTQAQAMHRKARHLAEQLQGVQLEDKRHAVALHCRRVPWQMPALQRAAEALIGELPGYELQPGNLVVEIKPAGMDKGRVVAELLELPPFAGRTPIYVGDDLTDEHAFATANLENGVSVRVGSREPTLAQFTLPSPDAVHAWLTRVKDAMQQPQGVSTHAEHSEVRDPGRP